MSKLHQIDSLLFMSNFGGQAFFSDHYKYCIQFKKIGKLRLVKGGQTTTNSHNKTVMTTKSINSSSCSFQVIKKF